MLRFNNVGWVLFNLFVGHVIALQRQWFILCINMKWTRKNYSLTQQKNLNVQGGFRWLSFVLFVHASNGHSANPFPCCSGPFEATHSNYCNDCWHSRLTIEPMERQMLYTTRHRRFIQLTELIFIFFLFDFQISRSDTYSSKCQWIVDHVSQNICYVYLISHFL